jgi:hypothetical protein
MSDTPIKDTWKRVGCAVAVLAAAVIAFVAALSALYAHTASGRVTELHSIVASASASAMTGKMTFV